MSGRLSDIYSQYPKTSGECACAADETSKVLSEAGMDNQIFKVYDVGRKEGMGLLLDSAGNPLSNTNYHEVVISNGRFYDALTGAEGVDSWEAYLKLWHKDHADHLRAVPK